MRLLDQIEVVEKKRQRENDGVIADVKKWLKKNLVKSEYIYNKHHGGGGFNRSGRPDTEITYRGLINYFEFKDEGGRLSTLQIECIASYKRAGVIVHVVENIDEFLVIWKRLYN